MNNVKLIGYEDVMKRFDAVGQKAKTDLGKAIKFAFKPMVDTARNGAPYRTGNLKRAIRFVATTGTVDKQTYIIGGIAVGPNVEKEIPKLSDKSKGDATSYWHFSEFGFTVGKRKIPAHPYIRPAWDRHHEDVMYRFKFIFGGGLEKAWVDKRG